MTNSTLQIARAHLADARAAFMQRDWDSAEWSATAAVQETFAGAVGGIAAHDEIHMAARSVIGDCRKARHR